MRYNSLILLLFLLLLQENFRICSGGEAFALFVGIQYGQ